MSKPVQLWQALFHIADAIETWTGKPPPPKDDNEIDALFRPIGDELVEQVYNAVALRMPAGAADVYRERVLEPLRGIRRWRSRFNATKPQDRDDLHEAYSDVLDGLAYAAPLLRQWGNSIKSDLPEPNDEPDWDGAAAAAGESMMSSPDLARKFGVDAAALHGRLKRWQKNTDNGWMDAPNPGPRDPRIIYQVAAVIPVVRDLWRSSRGVTRT